MPELLRLRGEALAQAGSDEAERTLLAAVDLARRQGAIAWELRAAMSLVRLQRKREDGGEAIRLLASIYCRFSEGFETVDLKTAADLLQSLGHSIGHPISVGQACGSDAEHAPSRKKSDSAEVSSPAISS